MGRMRAACRRCSGRCMGLIELLENLEADVTGEGLHGRFDERTREALDAVGVFRRGHRWRLGQQA